MYITANLGDDEKANVQLINYLGQIVGTYNITNNSVLRIDVSNLPAGVYLCNLADNTGKKIASKPFTIQ